MDGPHMPMSLVGDMDEVELHVLNGDSAKEIIANGKTYQMVQPTLEPA